VYHLRIPKTQEDSAAFYNFSSRSTIVDKKQK